MLPIPALPHPASCGRLLTLVVTLALAGCGGYVIRGKVVPSDFSTLAFVPADDPRLSGAGVPNVEIRVHRDATRPNERLVARGVSDGEGTLSIPLSEFGAGWMVEQWRIQGVRAGYQPVDHILTLPGQGENRRLLIMMAPGHGELAEPEDLMKVLEQFR